MDIRYQFSWIFKSLYSQSWIYSHNTNLEVTLYSGQNLNDYYNLTPVIIKQFFF